MESQQGSLRPAGSARRSPEEPSEKHTLPLIEPTGNPPDCALWRRPGTLRNADRGESP